MATLTSPPATQQPGDFSSPPKTGAYTKAQEQAWQSKGQNLNEQFDALGRLRKAAQQNVADLQSAYDTSSRQGLQNIRYESGAAMAAQRGRNPYDVTGARQTALSRGATEAGFIADQAAKWQPAIGQARISEATTASEALGKERQLMDVAKASQARKNQALAAASKILDEETTVFNTAGDREKVAQKIENQLMTGEDDPVVYAALLQYVQDLRAGKIDAAGLDIPSGGVQGV